MQTDEQVIFTIIGTGLCLGGWAVFYLGTRVLGLALGLGFGFFFGELLAMVLKLDTQPANLVSLACALLGAFGGLVLMRATTTFAFGLAGFLFGALLGRLGLEIHAEVNRETFRFTTESSVIVLLAAATMGVLAVWLQKYVMIVITSYIGANFLVEGVDALAKAWPWSFLAILLAGILWQWVLVSRLLTDDGRRRPPRDDDEDD